MNPQPLLLELNTSALLDDNLTPYVRGYPLFNAGSYKFTEYLCPPDEIEEEEEEALAREPIREREQISSSSSSSQEANG